MQKPESRKLKIPSLLLASTFWLLVSACGFTPLYSNTNTLSGGRSSLDNVWVETIADADGLALRNNLIDRFYHNGTPEDPTYTLRIVLTRDVRDLAIQKDATTTRSQIVFRADYTLLRQDTRQTIDSGSVRAIGSYNILSSQYTTLVTENAAREQALQEMADKIALRLSVVVQNQKQ